MEADEDLDIDLDLDNIVGEDSPSYELEYVSVSPRSPKRKKSPVRKRLNLKRS